MPRNSKIANRKCIVCRQRILRYIADMNWLTKQEQLVICIVIGLLLTGLAVKYYRAAHPAAITVQPAKN